MKRSKADMAPVLNELQDENEKLKVNLKPIYNTFRITRQVK